MLESKTIFEQTLTDKEQALRLHYNRLLESAQVGDKPFDEEFYREAPLPHALNQATSIVVMLGDHVGDATLSVPVITSLVRYIELNSLNGKKITVISSNKDLFTSIKTIYPTLDLLGQAESFHPNQDDVVFCFNLNRKFHDYGTLGMKVTDGQDPMKVFSHDCQDWIKELIPTQPGIIKKYDPLPSRIIRNMEILFGQKLYGNIYDLREFIPKEDGFEDEKEKLVRKFDLDRNKPLITISPGTSVKGKEYTPENWESLIKLVCQRRPDIQILFMNDTDEEKQALYGSMIDHLKTSLPNIIQRGSVGLHEMNTLMHMTCLSVTPDTGLGHYSSMCGTPNVMFGLSNSVFWSGPNTVRVTHPYGRTMIRNNALVDLSPKDNKNSFYYGESGNERGASDISPERVANRIIQTIEQLVPYGQTL